MADYSNIESSTDIKIRSGFNLNNYSHEQLEQKLCAFVFMQLKNDKIVKVSITDESANPQAHFFNTRQLHSTRILLYTEDGDKCTGIWDNYKGQGEVSYKDGKKYKGYWDGDYFEGIKRHGLGTLYSADGQVLNQGKWDKDKYKGKE